MYMLLPKFRLRLCLMLLAMALAGCGSSPFQPAAGPTETATPFSLSTLPTAIPLATSALASVTVAPATPAKPTPSTAPPLALAACTLSSPGAADVAAECGTLMVYANRAANSGPQIGLHVAVLKASGASPAADPLFFIAGGPGQAATQAFLGNLGAFAAIRAQRDIVLVDQRGTGQSHPLNCPALGSAFSGGVPAQISATVGGCLSGLDLSPTFFTTSIAVDDLEAVRAALGYTRIDLYGVSYGTRVALAYLRRYPDQARALILDGIVLPTTTLGLTASRDAQRALNAIFKRCVNDRLCHAYFRDPQGDFHQVAQALQTAPAPVDLTVGGAPVHVELTYDLFARAVWLMSYSPATAAQLPLFIHEARFRHNYAPLASAALLLAAQLNQSLSAGASAAVLCSEDAPYINPAKAAGGNASGYLGNSQTDAMLALCQDWPAGFVPRDARGSISSLAPVLLLSGDDDPVTPPNNGLLLARDLPNSLDLVVPGGGHGVLQPGCLAGVAAAFLAAGSPNGLDARCINALPVVKFQTTMK
jgi:pimeloyl-ACP methyl ester carboxylesterase